MRAVTATALGAMMIALSAGASAQDQPEQLLRPFGSEPLVVAPPGPSVGTCDADCLTGLARSYMDALARQDGSGLPWAGRVRYAENNVPIMVGDGVWATANKIGEAPLVIADADAGTAVWLGMVEEHGQPGFFALELTAQGDRIADVQITVRRQQGRPPFGDPTAFRYDPAFRANVAEGARTPRAIMLALVTAYLDAQGGGGAAPPFAKGCTILENGLPMTGNMLAAKGEKGECAGGFARGLYQELEGVRRRVVAVDEGKGLVVVAGARDLPAEKSEFTATDGKPYPAEATYPRSVGFMTVFKIESGAIARVASIATELPYLMHSPWKDTPRGRRRTR